MLTKSYLKQVEVYKNAFNVTRKQERKQFYEQQFFNMADKLKKLSLEEEEKLAFKVKKYPCLFDKSDKGYKEKDCVSNAWEKVSNSLDFIQNGNTTKSLFERLRKRYNKKKNEVKKSKRSGSGARESEKALRVYQFLFWLDSFTYLRESCTNINDNEDDGGEEDDDDNKEVKEGEPTIESDVFSIGSDDENESSNERSVLETSKTSSAANSPVVSVVSGKQKVKKAMKRKVDESSSSKEKSKKEGIRKGKTSKRNILMRWN